MENLDKISPDQFTKHYWYDALNYIKAKFVTSLASHNIMKSHLMRGGLLDSDSTPWAKKTLQFSPPPNGIFWGQHANFGGKFDSCNRYQEPRELHQATSWYWLQLWRTIVLLPTREPLSLTDWYACCDSHLYALYGWRKTPGELFLSSFQKLSLRLFRILQSFYARIKMWVRV